MCLMLHNMMPQTRKAVEAIVPYAKACSEAHVHMKGVSGFMHGE